MKKYIFILIALIMSTLFIQGQTRILRAGSEEVIMDEKATYFFTTTKEGAEVYLKKDDSDYRDYTMPVSFKNTTNYGADYTFTLLSHGAATELAVLREIIKYIPSLKPREVEKLINNAPSVLVTDFSFEQARELHRVLIALGAKSVYDSEDPNEQIYFDPRDGYDYRITEIDGYYWLADNLMYMPEVMKPSDRSETESRYYVYDYEGDDLEEAIATENFLTHGVLYNKEATLTACPDGWELPTDEDFDEMFSYLGSPNDAYNKLREPTNMYWNSVCEKATNETGLNALPSGQMTSSGKFQELGFYVYWWNTRVYIDQRGDKWYYGSGLSNEDEEPFASSTKSRQLAMSVRCVKEKPTTAEEIEVKHFIDTRDGTSYEYALLGNEYWMLENLAYLPEVHRGDDTSSDNPRYYVYDNNFEVASEVRGSHYHDKFGSLYNYEAAKTACPKGWHMPTIDEWDDLFEFIGGDKDTAHKLKSTTDWNNDQNGEDSYLFNALPGGYNDHGYFTGEGKSGNWWMDDKKDYAIYYFMSHSNNNINVFDDGADIGLSLRCVKDKQYTLTLIGSGSGSKLEHVKIVRDHTGLGLAAAKSLVDNAPSVVLESTDFEKVRTFYRELITASANAEYECDNPSVEIFFDPRDGYDYRTTTIDGVTWFADNLMYLPAVSSRSESSQTEAHYYVYSYDGNDVYDAKQTDNYKTYGVLYNQTATDSACPEGWKLPKDEASDMVDFLGGPADANKALREANDDHWDLVYEDATNSTKFYALPGGSYNVLNFVDLGKLSSWWLRSDKGPGYMTHFGLTNTSLGFGLHYEQSAEARSIRCIKE